MARATHECWCGTVAAVHGYGPSLYPHKRPDGERCGRLRWAFPGERERSARRTLVRDATYTVAASIGLRSGDDCGLTVSVAASDVRRLARWIERERLDVEAAALCADAEPETPKRGAAYCAACYVNKHAECTPTMIGPCACTCQPIGGA